MKPFITTTDYVTQLKDAGYKQVEEQTKSYMGHGYKALTLERKITCQMGCMSLVASITCCCAATLFGCQCFSTDQLCSEYCNTYNFTKRFYDEPCSGKRQVVCYIENEEQSQNVRKEVTKDLGFDPYDNKVAQEKHINAKNTKSYHGYNYCVYISDSQSLWWHWPTNSPNDMICTIAHDEFKRPLDSESLESKAQESILLLTQNVHLVTTDKEQIRRQQELLEPLITVDG